MKTYPIEEALKAQKALRDKAGLGPEQFPLPAFIGMISDEIEKLRHQGIGDSEIAALIRANSRIDVNAEDISQNFAPADQRHPH